MYRIFINQALTETTVVGFIQNRLREFGIENKEIECQLYDIADNIVEIIRGHFQYLHLLSSEQDIYFDEISYLCRNLVTEITSTSLSLSNTDFKQFVFILIKVLDQIFFESKEEQIDSLSDAIVETEKDIIKLIP